MGVMEVMEEMGVMEEMVKGGRKLAWKNSDGN